MLQEVARQLRQLVIAPATLSWLDGVVVESDQTEQGARQRSLKALQAESERLQTRIDTMYMDRLDGRISAAFFDAKSKQWRQDQKQIHERIQMLKATELMTAARAVEIVRGVSEACAGFETAKADRQRELTMALLQNATWKAGQFESALKSPFDKLAHSNSVSQRREREKPGLAQEIEIWLPKRNAFRNSGERIVPRPVCHPNQRFANCKSTNRSQSY
jgi:hypothetical protein